VLVQHCNIAIYSMNIVSRLLYIVRINMMTLKRSRKRHDIAGFMHASTCAQQQHKSCTASAARPALSVLDILMRVLAGGNMRSSNTFFMSMFAWHMHGMGAGSYVLS
jgi:hypothetical protein